MINLKLTRIKKGLTQTQLSEMSGVSLTSITKIEKHGIKNTTISILEKLALSLDTTVQELFFNEEE